jgi:hypothetical protein
MHGESLVVTAQLRAYMFSEHPSPSPDVPIPIYPRLESTIFVTWKSQPVNRTVPYHFLSAFFFSQLV